MATCSTTPLVRQASAAVDPKRLLRSRMGVRGRRCVAISGAVSRSAALLRQSLQDSTVACRHNWGKSLRPVRRPRNACGPPGDERKLLRAKLGPPNTSPAVRVAMIRKGRKSRIGGAIHSTRK